jgi:hypothetical protein
MSTTSSIAFIPFTCPHCGAFTEVELAYAGKSGPCFVCGRTVKVPYVTTGTGLRTIQAEGVSPQAVATVTPARSQLINAGLILFGACLLLGAIGAIGFKLAAPAIIAIKKSSAMSESQSNMQQIVLILPFLGENRVYGMYNMSEPWDSQNNIRLASEIPSVFHCTIDPSAKSLGETSYVVAIGPKTAFRDPTFNADEKTRENEKVKLNEITDGIESTILVVEYHQSGIGWTEPKDLNFGRMSFNINEDRSNTEIRSKHDGCAFVIRADGTPIKLEDGAAPGDVRAMLTIDGDEAIDWTQYDDDPNTTTSTPK